MKDSAWKSVQQIFLQTTQIIETACRLFVNLLVLNVEVHLKFAFHAILIILTFTMIIAMPNVLAQPIILTKRQIIFLSMTKMIQKAIFVVFVCNVQMVALNATIALTFARCVHQAFICMKIVA